MMIVLLSCAFLAFRFAFSSRDGWRGWCWCRYSVTKNGTFKVVRDVFCTDAE